MKDIIVNCKNCNHSFKLKRKETYKHGRFEATFYIICPKCDFAEDEKKYFTEKELTTNVWPNL